MYRRLGGLEAAMAGRSAEDELLERFTDDEVKQALEALPEQFRIAVLLADVEGFSYKEIAEILDVPIGTVMSRLASGKKRPQKRRLFGLRRGPEPRCPRVAARPKTPTDEDRASAWLIATTCSARCIRTSTRETDDRLRVRHRAPPRRVPRLPSIFDFQAELRQVIARKCHDPVPDTLRQRVMECIEGETTNPI